MWTRNCDLIVKHVVFSETKAKFVYQYEKNEANPYEIKAAFITHFDVFNLYGCAKNHFCTGGI